MTKLAFDAATVVKIIDDVEHERTALEDFSPRLVGKVKGMSGRKFRSLMARLTEAMPNDLVYLEMGIYQAMTPIIVAAMNPGKTVIGVDDFSQFDKEKVNYNKIMAVRDEWGLENLEIHQGDFETYLVDKRDELARRVGVYFFDASHDYRSQMLALQHATQWLAPGGIVVVDDCNYPHVRQATADFVTVFPEFKLLFENYTGIRYGEKDRDGKRAAEAGWWNGVNIMIHDPENRVQGLKPPVPSDLRGKFVAQHAFAGCDSEGAPMRYAKVA